MTNLNEKDFKKKKKIMFYNDDNLECYFDFVGNFYFIVKTLRPTNLERDNYYKQKKNENDVYIKYYVTENILLNRWCNDFKDFEEYDKSCSIKKDKDLKTGFSLENPLDKKYIVKLPYINLYNLISS